MGLRIDAAGPSPGRGRRAAAQATPRAVAWHDVECGDYDADLPLWHELAADARTRAGADPYAGAILEIGAGTGRVALDLLARGHDVTALDCNEDLLAALRERAGAGDADGSPRGKLTVVCADARALGSLATDPVGGGFALCIAAMQTLQLFGGPAGRALFLRGARAHLRPGGVLACAIVTEPEEFDCAAGDPGPSAEQRRLGGREYTSRAVRVAVGAREIAIERERVIGDPSAGHDHVEHERSIDLLDRLDAATLAAEATAAGFRVLAPRTVPETGDHIASTVVMLGA